MRDRKHLRAISSARIHNELAKVASEEHRGYMLVVMSDLGILRTIEPHLVFNTKDWKVLNQLKDWSAPTATFWVALAWPKDLPAANSISSRLGFTKPQRTAVSVVPQLRRVVQRLEVSRVGRYQLVLLLEPFPIAAAWTMAAASSGTTRERLLEYLREARSVRPILRGDDLITLGVPRGPAIGEMLARLRAAKLDREVRTRKQEEDFVRRIVNSEE
jgi:tRNA nucleotidyltransferase (CCA-adding enzyme)